MPPVQQFFTEINRNPSWAIPILIWSITWKGLALWKAAKKDQKPWFVAILVVNTLGLLEIVYLFLVPKIQKLSSKKSSLS